jgi:hypothetical protein
MCAGCSKPFTRRSPAYHCCHFRKSGFPFQDQFGQARPCGVAYHAGCVRAGAPFRTRLADSKGLQLFHQVPMPHFICEACQVRAELRRELHRSIPDLCLLMLERMRMIDCLKLMGQGYAQEIWDSSSIPTTFWESFWSPTFATIGVTGASDFTGHFSSVGRIILFLEDQERKRRRISPNWV